MKSLSLCVVFLGLLCLGGGCGGDNEVPEELRAEPVEQLPQTAPDEHGKMPVESPF